VKVVLILILMQHVELARDHSDVAVIPLDDVIIETLRNLLSQQQLYFPRLDEPLYEPVLTAAIYELS